MLTQTTLEKAKGRTLTGVAQSSFGNEIVLIFGYYYCLLGIRRGAESDEDEIREGDLNVLDFGSPPLVEAGVVTVAEVEEIRQAQLASQRRDQEAYDRREYERLQRKFGTPP